MESSMLNIIPQTKICTKCKVEKSIEMFHKHKAKKDGLHCDCKECAKAYQQANTEKIAEYNKAYKKSNNKRIKARDRIYNQTNSDKKKEYQQANREAIAANQKAYRQANKEKLAEYIKKYQKDNPELLKAYKQTNAEKISEYQKAYKQSPMGKAAIKNSEHKRRSITKQGDITSAQLLELEQSAKVCYWCGVSLKGKKVHIDHYVPLAKGGKHTLSNLVISCSHCNLVKNAKDPIEFAQSIGKLF